MSAGKVLAGLAMGLGGGTGLGAWWARRSRSRTPVRATVLPQSVAGNRVRTDEEVRFEEVDARLAQKIAARQWGPALVDVVNLGEQWGAWRVAARNDPAVDNSVPGGGPFTAYWQRLQERRMQVLRGLGLTL